MYNYLKYKCYNNEHLFKVIQIKNAIAVSDSQYNTGNVNYMLKLKDTTNVKILGQYDMFKNLENVEEKINLKELLDKSGILSMLFIFL